MNSSIEIVERRVKASQVPDLPFEFNELSEFQTHLKEMLSEREAHLVSALERSVVDRWAADHKAEIAVDFKEASPEMWANLRHKLRKSVESAREDFRVRICANLPETPTIEANLTAIDNQLGRTTVSRALFESGSVSTKMLTKFDDLFLLDQSGETRQWPNEPDIAGLFEVARAQSLEILRMFSACQLRENTDRIPPGDPLTQQLIGPAAMEIHEASFQRVIEQKYIEAVRIKEVSRNRARIPPWMVISYVVLGAPKFMKVINHPFRSICVLLALLVLWALYHCGVFDPLINTLRGWAAVAMKWMVERLLAGKRKKRKEKSRRSVTVTAEEQQQAAPEAGGSRPKRSLVKAKSSIVMAPKGAHRGASVSPRRAVIFDPEPI